MAMIHRTHLKAMQMDNISNNYDPQCFCHYTIYWQTTFLSTLIYFMSFIISHLGLGNKSILSFIIFWWDHITMKFVFLWYRTLLIWIHISHNMRYEISEGISFENKSFGLISHFTLLFGSKWWTSTGLNNMWFWIHSYTDIVVCISIDKNLYDYGDFNFLHIAQPYSHSNWRPYCPFPLLWTFSCVSSA